MWKHWHQVLLSIPTVFLNGALPAKDLARAFRWLLCVLALTALFWGGLAVRENITEFILGSTAVRSGLHIEAVDVRWHVLPPALSASRVQLQHDIFTIEAQDVRLSLGLTWPAIPVISVQASLLGGQMNAAIIPSGWIGPQQLEVEARWKNLDAHAVQNILGQRSGKHLLELERGRISGSLTAVCPTSDFLRGRGTLNMDMEGLGGVWGIPLLTSEKLEHMLGRFSLLWQEDTLRVEEAKLTNQHLRLDCQGSLNLTRAVAQSALRLRMRVAVEPGQIRLALLPPRSQAAFALGQTVEVLLSGTLSKPEFSLATAPATAIEVRP